MDQSQQPTQEQLEKHFVQQQNFFYETISQKLKKYGETLEKTKGLLSDVSNLNLKQFELLGCLAYLTGLDYTNQQYHTQPIIEKVEQRFAQFGFDKELFKLFEFAILTIKESDLIGPKNLLKDQISKEIFVQTEDKLIFAQLRGAVKKVFNNSLVPVNMAVPINTLTSLQKYTYDDLLKINSLINRQCKYLGSKCVKNVLRLYSDDLWSRYLAKATKYFDDQKFAVVYYDQILSVKESTIKFSDCYSLYDVISGEYKNSELTFEQIQKTYEENLVLNTEPKPLEEVINEKAEALTEKSAYQKIEDDEVMALISKNYPLQFIWHVLSDELGFDVKSIEDLSVAISKLFDDENDYIQHIHHYTKSNTSKVKFGDVFHKEIDNKLIVEFLDEKYTALTADYKKSIEIICQELPVEIIGKVKTFLHICIGDLVLVTDDEKQYLISEIMESGVTTYQQLAQILSIIEKCDIIGEQLFSYVTLNKYLTDTSEIVEIFKESENLEGMQMKISVFKGFLDFFRKTIEPPKQEVEAIN